jgi:hypothetical protein
MGIADGGWRFADPPYRFFHLQQRIELIVGAISEAPSHNNTVLNFIRGTRRMALR